MDSNKKRRDNDGRLCNERISGQVRTEKSAHHIDERVPNERSDAP